MKQQLKSKTFGILAMAVIMAAMGMNAEAKAKSKGALNGVVNINQASVVQLTMLPGVGPKKAQAIRTYAKAHTFKKVDEIKKVKGIGDKALAKLKPFLTVTGPTTAKWLKSPRQQAKR